MTKIFAVGKFGISTKTLLDTLLGSSDFSPLLHSSACQKCLRGKKKRADGWRGRGRTEKEEINGKLVAELETEEQESHRG